MMQIFWVQRHLESVMIVRAGEGPEPNGHVIGARESFGHVVYIEKIARRFPSNL